MQVPRAHDRFSRSLSLSEASIRDFAAASGDTNPLHRDRAFARSRGFVGPIASGPQTSALLMGVVADHFAKVGPMVGLEFRFWFRSGVPADAPFALEWLVVRVASTASRRARVVDLRGRLRTDAGVTAVGAAGTVLVWDAASA